MIGLAAYYRPRVLSEALDLMASENCLPLAGGTDLIPQLRTLKEIKVLDIGRLGMNYIEENEELIEIGAACTHARLASNGLVKKFIPLLGRASSLIGSQQIRNRGTIGGNIANASPCADTFPALLNYEAKLVLLSKDGQRRVKLADFITEPYRTDRKPGELLFCIICKKVPLGTGYSYLKLGRRQAVNISRMTISVSLRKNPENIIEDVRIAAGSVFPVASRMNKLEETLTGQRVSAKLLNEAGKYAANLMIEHSGYRWSTPYKEPVLSGMMTQALVEASSKGN
jgi:CO/xanthine dehydrogenase FAD-binding subunit